MSGRPTVIFTRPANWVKGGYSSEKMTLVHAPMGGSDPRLRKGHPAGDSVGVLATHEACDNLIQLFGKHKPDVFLHWVHYGAYDQRVMRQLRQISPKTLFVFGQGNQVLHHEIIDRWIMENKEFVDVVLTNTYSPKRHKIMRDYGIKYTDVLWTFGFTPDIHNVWMKEPVYDCFFGGGNTVKNSNLGKGKFPFSRFRYDFLHAINKKFKLHVRGGGWDLAQHVGLHALEYFREIQKAKIVLGTYHFDLKRYYTKRTVYGGASGRMMMTRYIPGMEKDFENHENIVWFHTIKEAIELIEYYLNNDDEREKIAKQTREHFVKNHSWKARLKDFEGVMQRLKEVFNE